jgi:sugar phosphate isomerase/epimerase
MTVHPRLAINSLSTAAWPLERDLEEYAKLGVHSITLYYDKLEPVGVDKGIELVQSAGVEVLSVFTRGVTLCQPDLWAAQRDRLRRVIGVASALGASLVIITTGAIGDMTWEEGVAALDRSLEPLREAAAEAGITIGIEQTLPVRVEVGFIHSFKDIVEVARRLDLGAVYEANYSFNERGIDDTIGDSIDVLATVQLDDLVPPSTIVPDRAVPGDGVIPLTHIVKTCVDAGYDGAFELEVLGPRIEQEGYESVLGRSIAALNRVLTEAGA